MDISGEAADLVVREGLQAAEAAAKLTGTGVKNVAALLMALTSENYKVTGETSAKRLARDPAPAEVIQLKQEDIQKFRKLAKKYGILYFMAQKKGNDNGLVNVISNQNYAAQLNAVMEELGYPIPSKEETASKKAPSRAQPDRSSTERGNGLNLSQTMETTIDGAEEKPSVKQKLAVLQAAAQSVRTAPERTKEHIR